MPESPTPSTALVPVATLDPTYAPVDRFLARVAALTPAQWGALDAAGQRLQGGDPIVRWRRARQASAGAVELPLLRDLLTIVVGVGELAYGAMAVLIGERRTERLLAPAPRAPRTMTPESVRFTQALGELTELTRTAPGGPGAVDAVLGSALVAVLNRARLTPAEFAAMYAPIEPVIPAASLG